MQKLKKIKTPVLFAGSSASYDVFLDQTGLKPSQVTRVVTLEKLHGFQNTTLFYSYNFNWIRHDKAVAGYCRDHNIVMLDSSLDGLLNLRFV